MKATELFKKFAEKFPEAKRSEFREETTFLLPLSQIKEACLFCRDTLEYDLLIDICSVDHFGEEPRFEVVYELYSLPHGVYLRLKTLVSEDDLTVPTVSDIWPAADWEEREVYDMMGIKFKDHPDLRRILMWEGYPFYPLRKDFPLAGKDSNVPDVAFTRAAHWPEAHLLPYLLPTP